MNIKHLLLLFVIGLFAWSCNQKTEEKEITKKVDLAILQMTDSVKDLGQIAVDTSLTIPFYAKNVSDNPLIITKVGVSCSCTLVEYDKKPIKKGDSVLIQVKYTPQKGFTGAFEKSIVIEANIKNYYKVVYFKGSIDESKH